MAEKSLQWHFSGTFGHFPLDLVGGVPFRIGARECCSQEDVSSEDLCYEIIWGGYGGVREDCGHWVKQKPGAGETACIRNLVWKRHPSCRSCTLQWLHITEAWRASTLDQEAKLILLQPCCSSTLYWQNITSCQLAKENSAKSSDPFSQNRQKEWILSWETKSG